MLSASGTARPASADSRREFRSSLKPVRRQRPPLKNDSNMIAVGANFSGDFAGTSVTFGAGHVSYKATETVKGSRASDGSVLTGDTLKEWGLGTSIGIGDTTLSLRYDTKPDSVDNAVSGAGTGDSNELRHRHRPHDRCSELRHRLRHDDE